MTPGQINAGDTKNMVHTHTYIFSIDPLTEAHCLVAFVHPYGHSRSAAAYNHLHQQEDRHTTANTSTVQHASSSRIHTSKQCMTRMDGCRYDLCDASVKLRCMMQCPRGADWSVPKGELGE